MNEKALEILQLSKKLAEILKDKEVVADLKKLYKQRPEMFDSIKNIPNLMDEAMAESIRIANATDSNKKKDTNKSNLGD